MTNEQFKDILKYINLLIDQAETTCDADDIAEAFDQIEELIKFQLHLMEEEE